MVCEEKLPTSVFFTIALLGLWLFASTCSFPAAHPGMVATNLLTSVLLIWLGIRCRAHVTAGQIWAIAGLGIWLQFSPLLFWAPHAASYITDTFIGTFVLALSITLHPMPGHSWKETPTIPPGWSYNPSSFAQRTPIALLAFVCWMIARYLAAYQLGYIDTVWDPFFSPGTQAVLESSVSHAFPVSDAGLGAFAYTLEFFSACQGGANRWRTAPWLVLIFGILVIPVSIVSTILIILQPLAVGTWCTLCLATALCMLVSIPFAIGEVAATLQFLRHRKGKPLLPLLFFGGKCAGETPDTKTPSMQEPLWKIFRSSLSGMTFPWNLLLCALCGIAIMAIPSLWHKTGLLFDLHPILGALVTLTAVIALAEYARSLRWINLAMGILLSALCLLLDTSFFFVDGPLSLLLILCSIPKGSVQEKFSWKESP